MCKQKKYKTVYNIKIYNFFFRKTCNIFILIYDIYNKQVVNYIFQYNYSKTHFKLQGSRKESTIFFIGKSFNIKY